MRYIVDDEVKKQFKPYKRSDGRYCIELSPDRYLHWIESTNDRPVTCSNPDIVMQSWHFIEEAEGIIEWLKKRWSPEGADLNAITVQVVVDDKENK